MKQSKLEAVAGSGLRTAAATSPGDPCEYLDYATCPLCHTTDTTMTNDAVRSGADWLCGRCGQTWSGARLATVTAYEVWVSLQTTQPQGGV
jgi:hypothetical protein